MPKETTPCRNFFLKTPEGISAKAWSDRTPGLPCNDRKMSSIKTNTKLLEGFDTLSKAIMLVISRKEETPVESQQVRRDSIESHQALTIAQEDRIKNQEALTLNLQAQVASLSAQVSGLMVKINSHVCINNVSVIPEGATSTPIKPKAIKDSRVIPATEGFPVNLSTQKNSLLTCAFCQRNCAKSFYSRHSSRSHPRGFKQNGGIVA